MDNTEQSHVNPAAGNHVPKAPAHIAQAMPHTQAARIFAKFGGVPHLYSALLQVSPRSLAAIYRWDLPKATGGTGGLIPLGAIAAVQRAARLQGIVLTPEDWYPIGVAL